MASVTAIVVRQSLASQKLKARQLILNPLYSGNPLIHIVVIQRFECISSRSLVRLTYWPSLSGSLFISHRTSSEQLASQVKLTTSLTDISTETGGFIISVKKYIIETNYTFGYIKVMHATYFLTQINK